MQRIEDEEIIQGICEYAKKTELKTLMQEYLKRVILNKPDDPVKFLLQTIRDNPFTPPKPFKG
jgi:hypothetical protein